MSEVGPSGRRHILVVEEKPHIRETLTKLLEDLFTVHTASETAQALRLLEAYPIAVLITHHGDELLARTAQISRATRVLLTGYDDLEGLSREVNRGNIYAYVAKPWHPMELRLTIARAADHYELVRRLVAEKLLLNQLMEHTPDIIYFKDRDHRFTRVNRAKAALVGVEDPNELIGRGDWDYFSKDEADRIEQEDRAVVESQRPVVDQLHAFTPPDGKVRWFSTTKAPVDEEAGGGLVGISRDITERKLEQEEFQLVNRRLVEAESEKKAFYRQVVLAVTGGRLHLVDPDEMPPLPPPEFELSLAEPENYQRVREMLRELGQRAELTGEQVEDLVLAAGEAVTNAIKHAGGGTCLAALTEEGVVVRVWDQGQGIHPEDLPDTLFRAGFSTQVSLGLGYTLLLQLVDGIWLATGPSGTVLQLLKRTGAVNGEEADLLALLDRF